MGKQTKQKAAKVAKNKKVDEKSVNARERASKRKALPSPASGQRSSLEPNKTRKLNPKKGYVPERSSSQNGKNNAINNNAIPLGSKTLPPENFFIQQPNLGSRRLRSDNLKVKQTKSGSNKVRKDGKIPSPIAEDPDPADLDDGIRVVVHASDNDFGESEAESDDMTDGEDESEQPIEEEPDPELESPLEGDNVADNASVDSGVIQLNPPAGMELPTIATEEEAYQFMEANPHLGSVFRQMITQGIRDGLERQQENHAGEISTRDPPCVTPKVVVAKTHNAIKSPSDTTLYAPALRKRANSGENANDIIEKISNFVEEVRLESTRRDRPVPRSAMGTPVHAGPSNEPRTPPRAREVVPPPPDQMEED